MNLDLKSVLNTAGPTATLVFASWILLQYLNQRFELAVEHYQSLLSEFRQHGEHDARRASVHDEVLQCKTRFQHIRRAITVGLIAALFLLTTLATGTLSLALGDVFILSLISIGSLLLGVVLLMACAGIAIHENMLHQQTIDSEIADVPEFNPQLVNTNECESGDSG